MAPESFILSTLLTTFVGAGGMDDATGWRYQLTTYGSTIDDAPLDTTTKNYTDMMLGRWAIKCERDIFMCASPSSLTYTGY